jgi:hypothetical protein
MRKKVLTMKVECKKWTCLNNGLKIRGYEYRQDLIKQKAIIMSHGFLANQSMCKGYAKYYAKEGYACYTFDFCGGGIKSQSDGKLSEMSINSEIEDLMHVIQYVKSLAYIDSSNIILLGCSQGAFVSALTATKVNISKLILFYPALCIPDDARRGKMMMFKFNPSHIPSKIQFGPLYLGKCYPESVMNMDPFKEIQTYTNPVFIVHGTKDKIVNVSYALKAYQAYKDYRKNNNTVQLLTIKNAGHGFMLKHDNIAKKATLEFLKR